MRPHLNRMGIESRLETPAGTGSAAHPGAALEAAAQHLGRQPVAFEFLPPQVNRWQAMARQFDDRRRRWLAVAVAALFV